MKKRKIMISIFFTGLLLMGIGSGVAFAEFSSFHYGGEKIMNGEMTPVTLEQKIPEQAERIRFLVNGYGTQKLRFKTDSTMEADQVSVVVYCNQKSISPYIWEQKELYREEDEALEGENANSEGETVAQIGETADQTEEPVGQLGEATDQSEEPVGQPGEATDQSEEPVGQPGEATDQTEEPVSQLGEAADQSEEPVNQEESKELVYLINFHYLNSYDEVSEFFKIKEEFLDGIKKRVIYSYTYDDIEEVVIKASPELMDRIVKD